MTALAVFDAQGAWVDTLVCEGRIRGTLAAHGLAWGRWPVRGIGPQGFAAQYRDELAALPPALAPALAPMPAGTAARVTAVRLSAEDPAGSEPCGGRQAEHTQVRPELRFVLDGVGLFHIRTAQGFLGLLLEAGDWLVLPEGTRLAFDAGDAPDFHALSLRTDTDPGPAARPSGATPSGLPAFDAFVDTVLAQCGEDLCDLDDADA